MLKKGFIFYVLCCVVMQLLSLSSLAATFKDNFNDANLDGWTILTIEVGGLVRAYVDKKTDPDNPAADIRAFNDSELWMALDTGVEKVWSSWDLADITLTARIRLMAQGGVTPRFYLFVRGVEKKDDQKNDIVGGCPSMAIYIREDSVRVYDSADQQAAEIGGGKMLQREWHTIKAVAEGTQFQFYFDDHLVGELDDDAAPEMGTIAFYVSCGRFQIDDFVLTGPFSIQPGEKLAVTWGDLKHHLACDRTRR